MFRCKDKFEIKDNSKIIGKIVIYSGIANNKNNNYKKRRVHRTKDQYRLINFIK